MNDLVWLASSLDPPVLLCGVECAGAFGALQKVQVALYTPLFVGVVIAVYVLVKMATILAKGRGRRHAPPQYDAL